MLKIFKSFKQFLCVRMGHTDTNVCSHCGMDLLDYYWYRPSGAIRATRKEKLSLYDDLSLVVQDHMDDTYTSERIDEVFTHIQNIVKLIGEG